MKRPGARRSGAFFFRPQELLKGDRRAAETKGGPICPEKGATMGEAEDRRGQKLVLCRLERLGIEAELLPGRRSIIATLPLRSAPFTTLEGPRYFDQVRFATVGPSQIKCLEPLPFFFLPLVDIAGCTDAAQIEQEIRASWSARTESLRKTRESLLRLGVEAESEQGGALLAFGIGLEDASARARCSQPGQIMLPARGPLAGMAMRSREDRLFALDPTHDSAVDLEIAITSHLEQLARSEGRLADRRRLALAEERNRPKPQVEGRRNRVLLVGPHLARDPCFAEGLRLRGYEVTRARTATEALAAFDGRSFEVVFSDTHLGRCEGIELIPAVHSLTGIQRLPIVLVDDRMRPRRREASRRMGAAGYLVHPVEVSRIAPGLARVLDAPKSRRFERYSRRLAVFWGGHRDGGFTTELGRMGMFVCTDRTSPTRTLERCELTLPEIGETLRLEVEALYRIPVAPSGSPGIGLRFHSFPDDNESTLINYLCTLGST
jgi:two-component system chemotaxis response regulator CheY